MKTSFTFLLLLVSSGLFAQSFTLRAPALGGQASLSEVFNGFGCTGKNLSPALEWENPPAATQSFALTLFDPDAPTGSGWWHWVVVNLPADVRKLAQGTGNPTLMQLPNGAVQCLTDFQTAGYGGPCPPIGHGSHRYILTLYALDCKSLYLNAQTAPATASFLIRQHTLAQASVVFHYQR